MTLRKIVIAALLAAQIATPAAAADLNGRSAFMEDQRGAFAGLRIRARLGGDAGTQSENRLRASLTLAPTVHNRTAAATRMSMGEGIELGVSPGARPTVLLGGRPLDRLELFGEVPDQGDRANVSTVAKVAIVAGVIVVVGFVALAHIASEASCFHGGNDGDC